MRKAVPTWASTPMMMDGFIVKMGTVPESDIIVLMLFSRTQSMTGLHIGLMELCSFRSVS